MEEFRGRHRSRTSDQYLGLRLRREGGDAQDHRSRTTTLDRAPRGTTPALLAFHRVLRNSHKVTNAAGTERIRYQTTPIRSQNDDKSAHATERPGPAPDRYCQT